MKNLAVKFGVVFTIDVFFPFKRVFLVADSVKVGEWLCSLTIEETTWSVDEGSQSVRSFWLISVIIVSKFRLSYCLVALSFERGGVGNGSSS